MPPLPVLLEVYHGVRESLFDEYYDSPEPETRDAG
jgi:hypothetical protein